MEFGCSGGRGLINPQKLRKYLNKEIENDLIASDNRIGFPETKNVHGHKYYWKERDDEMNTTSPYQRKRNVDLVLGNIDQCLNIEKMKSPIVGIIFDLGLLRSTLRALKVFDIKVKLRRPRINAYWDDVVGKSKSFFCDRNGALKSIFYFDKRH